MAGDVTMNEGTRGPQPVTDPSRDPVTEQQGNGEPSTVSDPLLARATDARQRLDSLVKELGETERTVGRTAAKAAGSVRTHVREAEAEIRKHPLAWIAIAAGVGLLVGRLLSRTRGG